MACVVIVTDDLRRDVGTTSPVIYVCSTVNVNLGYQELLKYGMIDASTGLSMVSYLVLGSQSSAGILKALDILDEFPIGC